MAAEPTASGSGSDGDGVKRVREIARVRGDHGSGGSAAEHAAEGGAEVLRGEAG